MCTLLVAWKRWPEPWLLMAANRDEHLVRPAAPPRLWPDRPVPLIAPEDLLAGGTWWGVNSAGLFAAITNRFGNRPPWAGKKSRGRLVLEALERGSAEAAAAWAASLPAAQFNRFHLLLADRERAYLLVHDDEKIAGRELEPGWQVVTERSFGAGSIEREDWLRTESSGWQEPPTRRVLMDLLSVHREDPFAGTCVHAPWLDYGTRSSSILCLGSAPGLLHAEGAPCESAYGDHSGLLAFSAEPICPSGS